MWLIHRLFMYQRVCGRSKGEEMSEEQAGRELGKMYAGVVGEEVGPRSRVKAQAQRRMGMEARIIDTRTEKPVTKKSASRSRTMEARMN